jgi:putative ABC transport system substrate-binding protein
MRRREFILGSIAVAWPAVARAQQTMPVVGFISGQSPDSYAHLANAWRQGLNAEGFFEGQNVAVEYRWAEGQLDRLPVIVADLVRRGVAVFATGGHVQTTLSVQAATATIPIVFTTGSDPVKVGMVRSLNRPDGNTTGVSFLVNQLTSKRLELVRELVPNADMIGVLINPTYPTAEADISDTQAAATKSKLNLIVAKASTETDIDKAFDILTQKKVGALIVGADPFFNNRRQQLIALAARHALPTVYELREYVIAGGLGSYGTSITDAYRQAGIYVGRVLKGAKPADLPVVQSAKFELVINLRTAKALGLSVPDKLMALADEVIE